MSERTARRLLPITIGATDLLVDATRVLATESSANVQRNPTARPPWGWLLGSTDGLEVHSLDRRPRRKADRALETGQILIVERTSGERWGLVVAQTGDELEIAVDDVLPIEPPLTDEPYAALVQIAEGPRLLLDPDRLHPSDGVPARQVAVADVAVAAVGAAGLSRMVWTSIGGERRVIVGLSARQVVEVCAPPTIAPAPDTGRPLGGFMVYEGEPVPIVSYRRAFGLSACALSGTAGGERPVLIARSTRSERRVALPILDPLRTVELPIANRPQSVAGRGARWVRGAYQVDDGLLMVPDVDALTS